MWPCFNTTALNTLKEILDNNKSPQSKLNEIYKLINDNALDVLSKADNMGERFVKGIQMALNPLLKTFGIQLWKDRLKEIKALSTVSPLILDKTSSGSSAVEQDWQRAASTVSPLILDKPSSGSSAIEQDWQRAASNHEEVSVSINDKKLSDYAEKFKEFNTSNDLKKFFSEVILKEVNLTDEARENAMDYLMTTFHQGGLLHPVSSALFSFVKNSEKGMVSDSGFKRSVHIKTTESGFTVSEESNVKKIFIYENTGKNTQTISPESTRSPFVIKAEGKIDLDFLSNQGKNPVITVEKNKINYVDERITDLFTIKDSVEAETNSGSLRPNAGR